MLFYSIIYNEKKMQYQNINNRIKREGWNIFEFLVFFVLWSLQVVFIIALFIYVGPENYVMFYSRWCYAYVAINYTFWLLSYGPFQYNRFFTGVSYGSLFFFHGLIWLWTILTLALVVIGAPLIFEDKDLTKSDEIGIVLIGVSIAHFTPIAILILYIYVFRKEIAIYWYNTFKIHSNITNAIAISLYFIALPNIPIFVYILMFDPFEVYDVNRPADGTPLWALFLVAILIEIAIQFTLVFYLRTVIQRITTTTRTTTTTTNH